MLTDAAERGAGASAEGPRRVVGIDPGTRALGWGVVEQIGTARRCLGFGVIHPPDGPLCERLVFIDDELERVLAEHRPDTAAVESIFFSKDAQSAAKLGHARGVVLLRLRRAGLVPVELAPAQVKRAVVGRGRADKRQVALVVSAALGLADVPPSDAADALAVALTCLARSGFVTAVHRATGTDVAPTLAPRSRRGSGKPPRSRRR